MFKKSLSETNPVLQQSDGSQQLQTCHHCCRALAVAVPCHMHLPGFVTSAELPLSIATPDSVCPGAPWKCAMHVMSYAAVAAPPPYTPALARASLAYSGTNEALKAPFVPASNLGRSHLSCL